MSCGENQEVPSPDRIQLSVESTSSVHVLPIIMMKAGIRIQQQQQQQQHVSLPVSSLCPNLHCTGIVVPGNMFSLRNVVT